MRIKEFVLKSTIFRERLIFLEEKKKLYKSTIKQNNIYEYQLNKFNRMWKKAHTQIPFYTMWKHTHNLPDSIKSIKELNNFPTLTKEDIQINQDLIFNHLKDYKTISTGGSTGEPTNFPISICEQEEIYASTYLARSWWGINPFDDMLIFWGHSHLFGSGMKGKINQLKRVASDWLINIKRLNAYDMSVDTLEIYYKEVRKANPKSILGYTSSIYRLAKYIDENQLDIGNKSNLQGVIVTSETVTEADIDLIEKVFKVPCISEYGMAETGVISYSKNITNNIVILWDLFIATQSENNALNITTLYDKKFPLINYNTDDRVDILEQYQNSILKLNSIDGRVQDILSVQTVSDKALSLSGILMVHILKSYPNIYEISFRQLLDNKIEINIVSDRILDLDAVKRYFIGTIKKDHPNLNEEFLVIQQSKYIKKTIAGKIQLIDKEA